jgi:hypothetical protein
MSELRDRLEKDGAPGRIRTCDPKLRRLVLCPTELRAHTLHYLPVLPESLKASIHSAFNGRGQPSGKVEKGA